MRSRNNSRTAGIVLLALLLALAMAGIALLAAAQWWSIQRQRETEAELLFVGEQYRKAIERYYYAAQGNTLPTRLEDLLNDNRFPIPVHHLRKAYLDPVTDQPFQLLRVGILINGVASTSTRTTLKHSGFPSEYRSFEATDMYNQWKFTFRPPGPPRPGNSPQQSLLQQSPNGAQP